jgi:hypothetical protein
MQKLLALTLLLTLPLAGAQEEIDEEELIAGLKAEAEEHHRVASEAFAALSDEQPDQARTRELQAQAQQHLDEAIQVLDRLIEDYPDEERWAERLLEEVFGLSFWLGRFTIIDDFDYEALTTVGKPKQLNETAEAAMASAEAAEEAGDTGEAFYQYLDVVAYHGSEDPDQLEQARAKLRRMRQTLETEEILTYLRSVLKSDDPSQRAFAAYEMAALRTSRTAEPLVRALEDEQDAAVQLAILDALGSASKRAAGKYLARIARSKDNDLKLMVLGTLQIGVGGRHGAMCAQEFVTDRLRAVFERAVEAMVGIGGKGGAEALGLASNQRLPPSRLERVFKALVKVDNGTAAEVLISHCRYKGKNQEAAEDALVAIGEEAIVPCINMIAHPRYRKQVHYVLKRITGETMGLSKDKWLGWYVSWKQAGGGALPQYERGNEPWLGGGW